ncbi:hypothetical protein C5167_035509 [Papaver somniferum]|uniref:Uncharacterized protein n=1 Tax=Papaver somniferum TaxID=3469 RepID=A0A4Y7KJ01_PAPSO|nr:hypothetical protein C5167_035509 [Papaver somniferum]
MTSQILLELPPKRDRLSFRRKLWSQKWTAGIVPEHSVCSFEAGSKTDALFLQEGSNVQCPQLKTEHLGQPSLELYILACTVSSLEKVSPVKSPRLLKLALAFLRFFTKVSKGNDGDASIRKRGALHQLIEDSLANEDSIWTKASLLACGGGAADGHVKFWNTHTGACLKSVDTGIVKEK